MTTSIVRRTLDSQAVQDRIADALMGLYCVEHITRDVATLARAVLQALREGDYERAETLCCAVSELLEHAAQFSAAAAPDPLRRALKVWERISFRGWRVKRAAEARALEPKPFAWRIPTGNA